MRNVDCQVGYGDNRAASEPYKGIMRHTNGNIQCQKWGSQFPHEHGHDHLEEDWCRNPDKEPGVWCYTIKEGIENRWDECPVRRCSECDTG